MVQFPKTLLCCVGLAHTCTPPMLFSGLQRQKAVLPPGYLEPRGQGKDTVFTKTGTYGTTPLTVTER